MTSRSTEKRGWSAVLAMSLAAFAPVASEFMPVSLPTPIAAKLQITEGQGISVSGAFALVTRLVIAAVAARVATPLKFIPPGRVRPPDPVSSVTVCRLSLRRSVPAKSK